MVARLRKGRTLFFGGGEGGRFGFGFGRGALCRVHTWLACLYVVTDGN